LRAYLLAKTGGQSGWQAALVARSGVKRQTISKWTSPTFDGYPDPDALAAVAKALEVRPYEIIAALDGDGPLLDLSSADAESTILRVVERWARRNGLGPDQGPSK
jgi:transcriptional regulator with XRE-family HTH domain